MNLKEFFARYNRVAIAFSGGVDSSFLFYSAIKYNAHVCAYYVKSYFQPEFEFQDALRLADELDAKIKVIEVDVLDNKNIAKNQKDRCYYCKKEIFGTILKEARDDGYNILLDGTNFSDSYDDRPGMKAKDELKVLSPLRECRLTKSDVRRLSQEAGLFTWNKPSYSCLATRIQTDTPIELEDLKKIEKSEDFMRGLGFSDFRVRLMDKFAKIEVISSEFGKVLENREKIIKEFSKYYEKILLDLEARDQ